MRLFVLNRRSVAKAGLALAGGSVMPLGFLSRLFAQAPPFRWAVYYGEKAAPAAFAGLDLVVLESDKHPDIEAIAALGAKVVGYLSVGEVHRTRAYHDEVRREGILVYENPVWPGAFAVDVRDPRWRRRVLDELIPSILARGFSGVFLDTVDTATDLERRENGKYAGAALATIDLLKAMRARFPDIAIVLNRGYDILPAVAAHVDMVLAESFVTAWDFENKRPRLAPEGQKRAEIAMLEEARRINPKLRVLVLEYWPPEDTAQLKRLYAQVRALGYAPYVATVELDRVVPEPR